MATQKSKRRSNLFSEFHKRGITIIQEQNDLMSLTFCTPQQKSILVRVIDSQSRIKIDYQSHNQSPVKAIGVFKFHISTDTQPDFYILTFSNKNEGKTEFVIIETTELYRRFELFNHCHNSGETILLVLWLLQNNRLFDATHVGVEGEWYFIGVRNAEAPGFDFTGFLNNWDVLIDEKIPVSQPEKN